MLLREWSQQGPLFYLVSVLVLLGAVAAIMSTADSVLLSLSSILAKDVLGRTLLRNAPESTLTRSGKILSWLVMAVMVVVALDPSMTLWGLNQLKNELLGQVAPLFVLGVSWRGLKAKPALLGIVLGTIAAVIPTLAGWERLWGFHAGVLGAGAKRAGGRDWLVVAGASATRLTTGTPPDDQRLAGAPSPGSRRPGTRHRG